MVEIPQEIEQVDEEMTNEAMIKQREAQFEKMVIQLMGNGFTRRNAKRYIISQSKKQYAKFIKQVKANAGKEKPLIELTPEELEQVEESD